ncbi:MAG: response regulator [Bacteroidetes bacterium]|nr:response regulator [Bacteroidota bacterium]
MSQPIEQPSKINTETGADKSEVIIIDDDQSFSFMLKDYLQSTLDIKSELFSNGNDFLSKYKSNDGRKIILDYEFDIGPNGLVVLQLIKEINPLAIIIVVSAQDDLEKALETIRQGATDYFLKTNKTVFANIVSSLLKLKELEKNKLN